MLDLAPIQRPFRVSLSGRLFLINVVQRSTTDSAQLLSTSV